MFNNKVKTTSVMASAVTMIGSGTEIVGEIKTTADLRIDGIHRGEVNCSGKLILGINGLVEGPIVAKEAEIAGKVVGHITVKGTLLLQQKAYIDGDMEVGTLVVEAGATFMGRCSMHGQKDKPQEGGLKIVTKVDESTKTA